MTLLLFDIDGTLLTVNGTGRSVLSDALSALFGRDISTDGVPFSGRTDPNIFRSVLRQNGLTPSDETLAVALDAYAQAVQEAMRSDDVRVLPGVQELLTRLSSRDDVQLGIVTGNVEAVAVHKLRVAELDTYFPVGAFGSDHADRSALPPLAAERAGKLAGMSFAAEDTVVFGDTPHDIRCARDFGASAVAVCTGGAAWKDLGSQDPDLLLTSFVSSDCDLRDLLRLG